MDYPKHCPDTYWAFKIVVAVIFAVFHMIFCVLFKKHITNIVVLIIGMQ